MTETVYQSAEADIVHKLGLYKAEECCKEWRLVRLSC